MYGFLNVFIGVFIDCKKIKLCLLFSYPFKNIPERAKNA